MDLVSIRYNGEPPTYWSETQNEFYFTIKLGFPGWFGYWYCAAYPNWFAFSLLIQWNANIVVPFYFNICKCCTIHKPPTETILDAAGYGERCVTHNIASMFVHVHKLIYQWHLHSTENKEYLHNIVCFVLQPLLTSLPLIWPPFFRYINLWHGYW